MINPIEPIEIGITRTVHKNPYKEKSQVIKDGFTLTEGLKNIEIILSNPEAIYSKDFIDEICYSLLAGKDVTIDCGLVSRKSMGQFLGSFISRKISAKYDNKWQSSRAGFVASELLSNEMVEKIEDTIKGLIDVKQETRTQGRNMFHLFGGNHILVKYLPEKLNVQETLPEKDPLIGMIVNLPAQTNEPLYDFGPNKYTNAQSYEVSEAENINFDNVFNTINVYGIIELKRRMPSGKLENFGLFAERSPNQNEIIINLNGQTEKYREDVFVPLVNYLLEKNITVVVDKDVDSINEIMDFASEDEDGIYRSILKNGRNLLEVEQRQIGIETHTCIVLTPRVFEYQAIDPLSDQFPELGDDFKYPAVIDNIFINHSISSTNPYHENLEAVIELDPFGPWESEFGEALLHISKGGKVILRKNDPIGFEPSLDLSIMMKGNEVIVDFNNFNLINGSELMAHVIPYFLDKGHDVALDWGQTEPDSLQDELFEYLDSPYQYNVECRDVAPGATHVFVVFKS